MLLDRHQPGHCSWWGGVGVGGGGARGARFGKGCSHGMGTDHLGRKWELGEKGSSAGGQSGSGL